MFLVQKAIGLIFVEKKITFFVNKHVTFANERVTFTNKPKTFANNRVIFAKLTRNYKKKYAKWEFSYLLAKFIKNLQSIFK